MTDKDPKHQREKENNNNRLRHVENKCTLRSVAQQYRARVKERF